LFLFIAKSMTGLAASYRMQRINSRDGLSNSAVLSLYQDENGYVWAGTYNGLNRYDGKFVESYFLGENNQGAQSSNIIQRIQGADSGHLWISAFRGLSKFSTTRNKVVESYSEYRPPFNLASDGKGLTCLVAKRHFISVYDRNLQRFIDVPSPDIEPMSVVTTFIDSRGRLWIFTYNNQIWCVNIDRKAAGGKPILKPRLCPINKTRIIYAFEENGLIFMVDEFGGLFSYDIERERNTYIRDIRGLIMQYGSITSIISYHDDLLVSFKGSGILKLVAEKKYAEEILDFSSGIFCMRKDKKQDVVWIGSDGQGIAMYSKKTSIFNTIKSESLPFRVNKPIRSIHTEKFNTLWIGTKGDGLICISDYDRYEDQSIPASKVRHFTTRNGLVNNQVFAVIQSRFHELTWLATDGPGLCYHSATDQKIHTLVNSTSTEIRNVHALIEGNDSTLWLATSGYGFLKVSYVKKGDHLAVKNIRTYTFERDNKVVYDLFSMFLDKQGLFWLGSRGDGVIRFNPKNGAYSFITRRKGFYSTADDIISSCNSKNSSFYWGTCAGLFKLDTGDGRMKLVSLANRDRNGTNEMIHGIQEDRTGCIWTSTNRGLDKYNPRTKEFHKCVNNPGLGVIEFSDNADYTCPYTGRIFFGGIDGVVWIEQNAPEDKAFSPSVLFNGLTVNGEKANLVDYLKPGKKNDFLELTHSQNSFSVSFIALDYLHSSNMEYQYLLENYNNEWMNAGELNEASFKALPPGRYTLQVKYRNDIFDTESRVFSLPIVVLPPWYLSTVALIIYVLLFLALLAILVDFFRKKIREKQQAFNSAILEKNREELYEAKMKFFTNITHEFLTPLTLIQGPCDRILAYQNSDDYVRKYASLLHMNVNRLQLLIHEIINFSKQEEFGTQDCTIEQVNLNEVTKSIGLGFSETIESNNIDFKLEVEEGLFWNTDISCLNKILMNLLSNAFKYTPAEGKICLSVQKGEEGLVLKVYNTGKGIPKDEIRRVFDRFRILDNMEKNAYLDYSSRNGLGLAICYNMIQRLGGRVEVESVENQYAEFQVYLPFLPLTGDEKEQLAPAEDKKMASTDEKAEPSCGMKKILIVDDNKEIVWMVSDLMADKYEILKAYNVREAFGLLDSDLPELIVADLMMPGELDGLDLVRRLKSNRFTSHIPIIVISARNSIEDQLEGLENGADLYVTKPFNLSYLRTMIEQLIEKNSMLREYYNSPLSAVELKGGQLIHQEEQDLLMQVTRIIETNLSKGELRPDYIAETLKMSPQVFYRKFKAISSLSPSDFVKKYRFAVAARLLITTNLSVQEVIFRVGINNRSYFYREFLKIYNTTPKDYRILKKENQEILPVE
jgi:signal transduction histidine kinase/DNA-binding response OmpR family regulator/ligand-binding sensor domain-containing protein